MNAKIEFDFKDPSDRQYKHYLAYVGAITGDPFQLAFWIQSHCFDEIMRDPAARTCSHWLTDHPPVVWVDSETDQ